MLVSLDDHIPPVVPSEVKLPDPGIQNVLGPIIVPADIGDNTVTLDVASHVGHPPPGVTTYLIRQLP